MSQPNDTSNDPLAKVRQLWSTMGFNLPGVPAPTMDGDELGKRISDLKAVEAWLSMNLSMLQMTIRTMEMQRTTLNTVKAMSDMASQIGAAAKSGEGLKMPAGFPAGFPNVGAESAAESGEPGNVWPWLMVQQVQEYLQKQAASIASVADIKPEKPADKKSGSKEK